jgi:hypothetical protein
MKSVLSQITTFVTVTIVALLVWLYAEDANIQTYAKQAVRVQFVLPAGADGLITPREPITVLVDFDGSNGQYQQFEDASDEIIEIELPIDQTLDLQALEIDLRDEIEQADRLKQLGINVTSVSPERTTVTYEKILDVSLDVVIRQRTGAIKLASANFSDADQPPRVTLRKVPASVASQIGNLNAIAWIDEEDVASLNKGTPQQITVDLELPGAIATLPRDLSKVDLLVTVADDRDTVQIERRPILLSYPPSINERYIIELEESDRFITAFELEGPRDQIALLKADQASKDVWASVRLSNEEADMAASNGGVLSKAVDIIAPRGVVLTSEVVRVSIKVIPRETTPAP